MATSERLGLYDIVGDILKGCFRFRDDLSLLAERIAANDDNVDVLNRAVPFYLSFASKTTASEQAERPLAHLGLVPSARLQDTPARG